MNSFNENIKPLRLDEVHDRLIDRGLREVIGKETPPDLADRILAAQAVAPPTSAPKEESKRTAALSWLVVAASLLVAGTFLLMFDTRSARRSSRLGNSATEFANRSLPTLNSLAKDKSAVSAAGAPTPSSAESPILRDSDAEIRFSQSQSRRLKLPEKQMQPLQDLSAPASGTTPQDSLALYGSISDAYATPATGPAIARYYSTDHLNEWGAAAANEGMSYRLLADGTSARQEMDFDANGHRWNKETAEGVGPHLSGDQYTRIVENPFIKAEGANAVSTFSIDVDTASYANVRQFLMGMNTLPPPDAVRIEELVNYFDYDYAGPNSEDEAPFAAHVEVAGCPWKSEHRLVRIGIKGREMDRHKRPRSNLVFLVDVSGSMNEPNKLPLVVYGLEQLTRELGENDRVAIVVYASSEGLVLPSTPGSDQQTILTALRQLQAGGSTAGGAGIQLAYQIAEDHFVEGGTNRVILCTDGDFNVGVTSTAELERLCEQKAKDTGVFLSVLGFGRGNLNDAMMEAIADHGNGNYHYVDNQTEARRVLVEEMTGTLVTIAKDVKIQVEFNPRQVAGYRLIGYENRMLRTEDFNDDTKDAGEIGAGHTVTALYEVVPPGQKIDLPPVDELKYQSEKAEPLEATESISRELLTLKMRYKQPDGETSQKLDWAVSDEGGSFRAASGDFQFAAAVAGFGLLLRDSQYKGNLTYAAVLELAQSGIGQDNGGYRAEFMDMVRRAAALKGQ